MSDEEEVKPKKGSKRKKSGDDEKKDTKAKGKGKAKAKGSAISRADFEKNAQTLEVTINGQKYEAKPKTFKTNSFGWQLSGKTKIKVGDTEVAVSLNSNFVIQGSKNAEAADEE